MILSEVKVPAAAAVLSALDGKVRINMKKIVIRGRRKTEIIETPTPKAVKDWALVKIHAAPMCTEYKAYSSGDVNEYIGHEAAGEVVEIAQPCRVAVGDRVVVQPQYPCAECPLCLKGEYIHCQNIIDIEEFTGSTEGTATYAQYMLKPSWLLSKIPDNMNYDHAGMLCCGLGPTFGAMERMNVDALDTVLLTGMGPVGLGGVINCAYRGARVIVVVGNPYREKLAMELGAHAVIDPNDEDALEKIMALTNGIGADKSIDCAGDPSAQRLLIDATRRNGSVAFVGESDELTIKVSDDMIRKGLTLVGAWHYNLGDLPKIMQIVQHSGDLLDKLITHTFPMNRVKDAWELQITRQCGKVVLHPWQ